MSQKRRCKDCIFSELSEPDPNSLKRTLYCYHSPPQIFPMMQQTNQGVVTVPASIFPGVQDDSWCYQFKAKTPMAIVDK